MSFELSMVKLALLALLLVAVAILLLGVKIFFSKDGKFPNSHVGGNKAMAERGVYCVQTQDYMEQKGIRPRYKKEKKVNQ